MPFSIDWFLTIPGILISVGVVLLIVALILFITSTMKERKEAIPKVLEENKAPVASNSEAVPSTPVSTVEEVKEPIQSIDPISGPVHAIGVPAENPETIIGATEQVENPAPSIEPVAQPEEVKEEVQPTIEPVQTNPEPVQNVEPVIEASEEIPLIDSVDEEIVIPSFEGDDITPLEEVKPVDENTEFVIEEQPIISNMSEETKPEEVTQQEEIQIPDPVVESHQIYGGADPLEATQNLPKVDVHHEPYSGGNAETTIADEPVLKVEETPVVAEEQTPAFVINEEPVSVPSMPAEEPVEKMPEIIAIPDDEIENL